MRWAAGLFGSAFALLVGVGLGTGSLSLVGQPQAAPATTPDTATPPAPQVAASSLQPVLPPISIITSADTGPVVPLVAWQSDKPPPETTWTRGRPTDRELERGDADLELRLVSDDGGAPVGMTVRLWRLLVPASPAWTAGDEIRLFATLPPGGASLHRLPRGFYRLECLDARRGASDPRMFELTRGTNDVTLTVSERRSHRQRILLVDETGATLLRANLTEAQGRKRVFQLVDPEWVKPRQGKYGQEQRDADYSESVPPGGWDDERAVPIAAGDDGFFDLGREFEESDAEHFLSSSELTADDRGTVCVDVYPDADETLLGILPRTDAILACVRFPDGSAVDPARAKVVARSNAFRISWYPPTKTWRALPVAVTVTVDGFEPLRFTWSASQADGQCELLRKVR